MTLEYDKVWSLPTKLASGGGPLSHTLSSYFGLGAVQGEEGGHPQPLRFSLIRLEKRGWVACRTQRCDTGTRLLTNVHKAGVRESAGRT